MKKTLSKICLVFSVFILSITQASAFELREIFSFMDDILEENNQNVVIGAGAGFHAYAANDGLRQSNLGYQSNINSVSEDDVTSALMAQVYVEVYLKNFAFGFREIDLMSGRDYITSTAGKLEQRWTVNNSLLTFNVVLLGASSYARFGILVGGGTSNYSYKETTTDYLGVVTSEQTRSIFGIAVLTGGYLDWGDEGFGGRLGYSVLQTDYFGPMELGNGNRAYVDATGSQLYLDIRVAF
ncbi:MAG: hypothetical protein ACI86H_000882 [bacterium]|jgi:hypothetical protein